MPAEFADIQQYMAPYQEAAASEAALVPKKTEDVTYGIQQQQAARSAAAAERARQEKMKELEAQGYGKPQRDVNESGGYTFYDDKGNPISAAEYAGMTGKGVGEVLQGSLDPGDIEFLKKYETFKAAASDPQVTQEETGYLKNQLSAYSESGGNLGKFAKIMGIKAKGVLHPDIEALAKTLNVEDITGIKPADFAKLDKKKQQEIVNGIMTYAQETYDELNHYSTTPIKDIFEEFVKNHETIFYGYSNPNAM